MLAITGGTVHTITKGVLGQGTVLVDGARIAEVGEQVQIPSGAWVIDVTGKVVMPGLIDAHCHLGINPDGLGREYSEANEMTDPITPQLRALDAIDPRDSAFQEVLSAGITTVMVGPGSGNLIGGQWVCLKTVPKPTIEQMVLKEPAGMKMALGENPRATYRDQGKAPSTRMGNAAMLRSALVEAQNYHDRWLRYRTAEADALAKGADVPEPPPRDLRMEALGPVLRRAMKARVHVHRADDMITAIRIAEEFDIDLTLEHATEGYLIADLLSEKNIAVTVGPISISRQKQELRGMTTENAGILSKAGVLVNGEVVYQRAVEKA